MTKFNYKKISQDLLRDLPERTQAIISRRFGFDTGNKETLDAIGQDYSITRERVRQIENFGMGKAIENAKSVSPNIFQYFVQQINAFGGFKREDFLLQELGGSDSKPHVLFLLNTNNQFKRFPETDDFFPAWAMESSPVKRAQKISVSFIKELEKINKPFVFENSKTYKTNRANSKAMLSSIELSKHILRNSDGLCGFASWPEINPKGIKDKAFLVLKKEQKPMHFTEVADFIQAQEETKKPYLFKTVHNELIKDNRFVLVGRGLYALEEWGYETGHVKDVIFSVLKKNDKPLPKQKIVDYVLKQRFVKENTILLNLNNQEYFQQDNKGRYFVREA
jgi:DNA-directed RNA polymerase delta subunit